MADRFLQDRVAVITGASRGIGRAIAVALAGAGAQLALVGRNQVIASAFTRMLLGADPLEARVIQDRLFHEHIKASARC